MSTSSLPLRLRVPLEILLSELLAIRVRTQRQPQFETYAQLYSQMIEEYRGQRDHAQEKLTGFALLTTIGRADYENEISRDERRRLLARTEIHSNQLCGRLERALDVLMDRHFSERDKQLKGAGAGSNVLMGLNAGPHGGMSRIAPADLQVKSTGINDSVRDRAFRALHAWGLPVYRRRDGTESRDPHAPSGAAEIPLEIGHWPDVPVWPISRDGVLREDNAIEWHEDLLDLAQLTAIQDIARELELHFAAFDELPERPSIAGRKQLSSIEDVARELLDQYPDPGPARSPQRKGVVALGVSCYSVEGRPDLDSDIPRYQGLVSRAISRQLKKRRSAK